MSDVDRLVALQQAADEEFAELQGLGGDEHQQQWERWRETVQAAITEAAGGGNRHELEAKVKRGRPAPRRGLARCRPTTRVGRDAPSSCAAHAGIG